MSVSWKGVSTNSVVPSFSRPDLTAAGPEFKARPIKHWRKQLIPTPNSGHNSRSGINLPMDTPGGSVYLGNIPANTSCLLPSAGNNAVGLKENIEKYDYICTSGNTCRPKIIRRASTIIRKDKPYYADTKAYLKSKGVLYDQKITPTRLLNETKNEYATQNCAECDNVTPNTTIYKPNNDQYSQQGAVDSSTRLTRLKLNMVNKNAASYKDTFGTTAPRYLGMSLTPYFLKSKFQNVFQPPSAVPEPHPPGTLDLTFNVGGGGGYSSSGVWWLSMSVIPDDDSIIAGGPIYQYDSHPVYGIFKINADGVWDTAFNDIVGDGFNDSVFDITLQPNGQILVGGAFITYNSVSCGNCIARLNADGTLDTTFASNTGGGFNDGTTCITVQPDNKILVGGYFTDFDGSGCNYITRLNASGTLDIVFNTNIGSGFVYNGSSGGPFSAVGDIEVDALHNIIIGGAFSSFNGNACSNIVRLDSSGNYDATFVTGTGFSIGTEFWSNPDLSGNVYSVKIQPSDGKILVGGNFQDYNGTVVRGLVRLNTNGDLDTSFVAFSSLPTGPLVIFSIKIQPNGQILVTGAGSGIYFVARLNGSDGSLDTVFHIATFNVFATVMAQQSTGKIIVGGFFSEYTDTADPLITTFVNSIIRLYN
jgi:uncharacterized delta-60 repeat protein